MNVWFRFLFVAIFLLSCTNKAVKTTAQAPESVVPQSWPNQMQHLTFAFEQILPVVADPLKYSELNNQKGIKKQLADLRGIAANIHKEAIPPDQDPSIQMISDRFVKNVELAVQAYDEGSFEFSRVTLKNSLAQCVQCHTRLEYGPRLSRSLQPDYLNQLNPIDRVNFLVASRHFNDGIKEIERTLMQDQDSHNIFYWQRLVQLGLVIHVRFNMDKLATQKFLDMVEAQPKTPYFIRRNLPYWKSSIKAWEKRPTQNSLNNAKSLIQLADKAQRESLSDGGYVDYLRAARMLHEFLIGPKAKADKAEALFLLGSVYDNVGEAGAWAINEDYYELCIKTLPHSDQAKKCYARMEESLISGFSGSSGFHLPKDVQSKLVELRQMAF